jgi:hypothetical protein
MKTPSARDPRRVLRAAGWCGSIALLIAIVLAYRWAEPSPAALSAAQTLGGGSASIRMDDATFAGYVDGARAWSIQAGQIDILRLPNATLTNVQSATITNIRTGTLYDPPPKRSPAGGAVATRVMEADAPAVSSGPVAATFRAKQGHYSVGMLETAPPDLEMLYTVQWQFHLAGDVVFRTRAEDEIAAPSMTIYNLVNRKTGRAEQRVMCDQGGRMVHKSIRITANSIRFNPKDRTVECLSGVRGDFKRGSVQAERVYWSLNDEVLRCPETATGEVLGMPFIAQGLTLDVKHRRHHADHIHIQLKPEALEGQIE